MTDSAFNRGKYRILTGSLDWTALRVVTLTSGYTFDADDHFVSDLNPASNEAANERLTVGGVAQAQDDTNDRANLNGDNASGQLTANNGDCAAVVVYEFVTGDSDSHNLFYFDSFTTFTPAGNTEEFAWDTTGIARLT